jgi:hypothetical protein
MVQEIEQTVGLAPSGAEVQVRDEYGAVAAPRAARPGFQVPTVRRHSCDSSLIINQSWRVNNPKIMTVV